MDIVHRYHKAARLSKGAKARHPTHLVCQHCASRLCGVEKPCSPSWTCECDGMKRTGESIRQNVTQREEQSKRLGRKASNSSHRFPHSPHRVFGAGLLNFDGSRHLAGIRATRNTRHAPPRMDSRIVGASQRILWVWSQMCSYLFAMKEKQACTRAAHASKQRRPHVDSTCRNDRTLDRWL